MVKGHCQFIMYGAAYQSKRKRGENYRDLGGNKLKARWERRCPNFAVMRHERKQ
jgi:hypothetical protein